MHIDIVTLFPRLCEGPLSESMMKRAQDKGLATIQIHNLRDWATDKHHVTDEPPYGGGQGMVLKAEPIFSAVEDLRAKSVAGGSKVLLMSPGGVRFDQKIAARITCGERHIIILCGHYEGVDQRVVEHLVDEEISIGDYVLTNGALAANVVVDAVVRLIPGVLGDDQSAVDDSFATGLLEFPQFTRPVEFRGWRVPDILLSGNHAAIDAWRLAQAKEKTKRVRPDLLGE